jgi:hypothetical protein
MGTSIGSPTAAINKVAEAAVMVPITIALIPLIFIHPPLI